MANLMMSHLRNLMEDNVIHGREPVKQAHSVILSSLESGAFTWADELKMAEKRRSAITRASQQVNVVQSVGQSSGSGFVQNNKVTVQGRWQGKQTSNSGSRASTGKKIIKSYLHVFQQ
jgi:hypothetical protein